MQPPELHPGRFGTRLPRQSAQPAGGGFTDLYYDSDVDTVYFYDYTRAKWLSVEQMVIQVATNANNGSAHYLNFGSLVMAGNRGWEFGRDVTVVGASFKNAASSSAIVELRTGLSTVVTLGQYGAFDFRNFNHNVDLNASTVYACYANGAAAFEAGLIYYRWR